MPRVLIFKEIILSTSETFILAQTGALRRYEARLAGLEPAEPSLPVHKPLLLTAEKGLIADLRAKLYRRISVAPRFHREIKGFSPDLIHAHFASAGRTAIALARLLSVPLVVTLHGADITVRGAAERYKELAKQVFCFICVSEFIRDRALEAGLPAEKLIVHYIGIDRSLFTPSPEPSAPSVLFIGRLVEKKGCEYLLRAMQLVQRTYPTVPVTIIGDGPLRSSLEELATTLNVSCRFLGSLPPAAVRENLRNTTVFCAPSVTASNGDSEGLPTVLAEAQACGVPVVTTLHAGIPEIIKEGETGFLLEERDHLGLAAAIERLLADEALRQTLRTSAIQRIENYFDLYKQTLLLEEIYDRALEKC